jgi:hypothetical protein
MGRRHMAVLSAFASWACSRQRLQLQLSCPGLHFQPQRQMKRGQPRPLRSKSTTGMLHSLSRGRGPIAPGMADYLRTALDKYGSSLTSLVAGAHIVVNRCSRFSDPLRVEPDRIRHDYSGN